MIAVIFEVEPADDQRVRYLDITATLRPLLSEIDGFNRSATSDVFCRYPFGGTRLPSPPGATWNPIAPRRPPADRVFFGITACAAPKSPATMA